MSLTRRPAPSLSARKLFAAGCFGLWLANASPRHARAAEPAAAPSDHELIEQLIKRIDQQDSEIRALKSRLATQPGEPTASATRPAGPDAPAPASEKTPDSALEKRLNDQQAQIDEVKARVREAAAAQDKAQDVFPSLQFHGFGDVNYVAGDRRRDRDAFVLGQLDFFITSQLSSDLDVLGEVVAEADDKNVYGVEVERLLLQYHPSEYFNLDLGRYHTNVGYYNAAYHHGTWFQTATGRPFFLDFEDGGGIIPAHSVGASAHGAIPSGAWGLGYVAEVGNGRAYRRPGSEENLVLNVSDDNAYKSVNLALIAKPEFAPGLQFGLGVYHDTVTPEASPRVDELMLHGHLVYRSADWEYLSEAYLIRHDLHHGPEYYSPAAFVQIARKFNTITPYVRFSYFDGAGADPIYRILELSGAHYGPGAGVRWEFATFAAFKAQYDLMVDRGVVSNLLTLQVAFTF